MLIWRGRGLVVLLAVLVFMITEILIDGANGAGYYTAHTWPKILAAVLAAIPIWFIGKSFENDGRGDHLWFIPVKWWAPVILIGGIFLGAGSTAAEPERSQPVMPAEEQRSVAAEPMIETRSPVVPQTMQASLMPVSPAPAAVARMERPPVQFPTIAQVYADNRTHLYYGEGCAHPDNAYRLAKSLAKSQGFKPAPGCSQ
jgi:hypothetical protein